MPTPPGPLARLRALGRELVAAERALHACQRQRPIVWTYVEEKRLRGELRKVQERVNAAVRDLAREDKESPDAR